MSLTAGVTLQSVDGSVSVALEQSLLNGSAVTVADGDGTCAKPVPLGSSSFLGSATRLVAHRGVTYAVLGAGGGGGPAASQSSESGQTPILRSSVGPQTGSWHAINTEASNKTVTENVFKLWLDLGPAPIANASCAYAVLPGLGQTAAAVALHRIRVVANGVDRQVVVYTESGPAAAAVRTTMATKTTMAVVHAAGSVYTEAELGHDLSANNTVILAITQTDAGLSFAYSRPTGGAGIVRLTAGIGGLGGLAGGLKTAPDPQGGAAVVRCSVHGGQQIVDLMLPDQLGRTAVGSCVAA